MAEKVPGWLERVLLPQISELKGEIKVVHSEINRLDQKIESLDEKLGNKIDSLDEKLSQRLDDLDKRLDVTQRLAAVEARVQGLITKGQ
jgi:predicted nuclease with TOPRIM domain